MVSFASNVRDAATFDIIVDGVVDAAALQAAKDFVLGPGEGPSNTGLGTNYEAGFAAALDWFSDPDNTLDNPDINQTIFISDGEPNRAYQGNGSGNVIYVGAAALDHVLGTAADDTVSEFDGLLGSFEGVPGTVDAVGIDVNGAQLAILDQVDAGSAENIVAGEQLQAVLGDLTQGTQLAAAGGDVITAAGGDDLVFGDVLFTDTLAADQGLGLPAGSGWAVIETLVGNGFFDQDPSSTAEEEILAFLRDPANLAAYDFGAESAGSGGRDGGNDLIDGGGGNDLIFGQEGDDTLLGGTGDDTVSGGSGADVFRWGSETSAGETDTLTDFQTGAGGDVLDLSALLSGVAAGDDGDELDAYLNVTFDGTSTTVAIDANGDGSGFTDVTVTIQGVDLTGGSAVQADIIDALLTDGNLQAAA
jgi:Ca2+-binding RTX toxin-like protein